MKEYTCQKCSKVFKRDEAQKYCSFECYRLVRRVSSPVNLPKGHLALTRGRVAIVDVSDFERVSQYLWSYASAGQGYAIRTYCINGVERRVKLQNFVLDLPNDVMIDHKNGNGLDNRRENLRPCNGRQNARNKSIQRVGSKLSQYKGVSMDRKTGRFYAMIKLSSRNQSLGYFINEIDAARAYDSAAQYYFGEFALTNFPIVELVT